MQTKTLRVSVGIKELARMMKMNEVEVSFFYYVDDLREIIRDYNFGLFSKITLIQKLEKLAEKCMEEGLEAYADGVRELGKTIQYNY